MPITFGRRDLLEYDAKHSVLICRECKYAVQKSALGSHLLRHKIYRGERQRLLSSIAQVELLEPDDVQLPPPGSPPVDGLPIIPGYRCTATGCESLCASSKRVRRHWSESHGVSDPPDSCARSVNLQTFFRGTKLRYFEVTLPKAISGGPIVTSDERLAGQNGLSVLAPARSRAQDSILPPGPPCDLDLDTLRYFHHFATMTSLTLPAENQDHVKHWQVEVVARALQLRWLMCGLLAISARHLAALSDDETTEKVHQKRSAQFLQEFTVGWDEIQLVSDTAEVEEVKAGTQVICIQRFYHWMSESPACPQEPIPEFTPFQLELFMETVQGCVSPNFALHFPVSSDNMPEEPVGRPRNESGGSSDARVSCSTPPSLLERFRTLPYRMAEALEKPDRALDFFATLSAIEALVECCSVSYASDDVVAVWAGMGSWLRILSDHFNLMVSRREPAALIVLAHWSLLIERAERHCWFLSGLAIKVLRRIIGELPEDSSVQSLVENLMISQ